VLEEHPAIARPNLRGFEPEILQLRSVAVRTDAMPPDDRAVELQHPHLVKLDVAGVELEERADSLQEGSRIGPIRLGTMGKLAEP
jgi:hypothetical protein